MKAAAVPVTVLTGFLGSGKTTLVNRLLRERPGTRFGLVVNEFGEASLESQLIEARKQPLYELPSGCLCCVSDGDLKAALDAVRRRDARIGHILVEASGLSSPGPLLGVLAQENGPYELSGVFCVADATSFLTHEKDFPALRRQLAFADAVFLTKTDLVGRAAAQAVRDRLAELKPGVKLFDAAGRLPWSALFEVSEPAPGEKPTEAQPKRRFFQGGRHHDAEVLEYTCDVPLDPDRLREVFADLDPGILRAKGVVRLDDPTAARYKYLVQYTGTQKQLYSRPWAQGEARRTSLVFLGSTFDASSLKARLDACAAGGLG
ncbi:MAG TPA: GTP-binding protein [Spirochaetia bacterium]|nr:GTP-binding protein [Spirochaetia bacterium]